MGQPNTPEQTEVWSPIPEIVETGKHGAPPSDAIVLFDGTNLDSWESVKGGPAMWNIENEALTVTSTGGIRTKQLFTSVQLHIEWRTPKDVVSEGQGRGNSGVFLQSQYEIQILDIVNNKTYVNGQTGALYKQAIPLVNAAKGPGEWQTYDIIYEAPEFEADSTLKKPAYITVLHNNVLIQNHVEIKGKTLHKGIPYYVKHGKMPLELQDHGNPVSFRNIWIREL